MTVKATLLEDEKNIAEGGVSMSDIKKSYRTIMDDHFPEDMVVKFGNQTLIYRKRTWKIPDEKTRIQRQIDATDKQIDKLVYDLYGLTEEEIKIVEGGTP